MVVISKPKLRGLTALCFALLALSTLTSAQMFADFKFDSNRRQAPLDDYSGERPRSAVDQLDGSSSVWDLLVAHQKDFLTFGGFGKLKEQFNEAYALLTGDPEARRQRRNQHRRSGALRSGQGTPEESFQRQKKFEEREHIAGMLERREVAKDIPTSNKMYEMWLENLGQKPGLRQEDK